MMALAWSSAFAHLRDGIRGIDPSKRVDAAFLVALRVLFGAAMCVSMIRFLAYGWVERFFVEPRMHFKYWGFGWVEPLGASGMHTLFVGLAVLAACMALGLFYRISACAFALGLAYVQLIDVSTYLNHYYLAFLLALLLAASPAGLVFSIDALVVRRLRPTRPRDETVAAAWLYLFRFQVAVVYICAGLAKMNADWLLHAQPLRIWLGAKTHLPLLGPVFTWEGVPLLMSWAGFLFDATIVVWLSWARTRALAYVVLLGFHAMTRLLFPIGMFPVIMSIAALVFFNPAWPRELIAWLGRAVRSEKITSWGATLPFAVKAHGNTSYFGKRAVRLAVFAYCAAQILLPLRGLAYGGSVQWHEQGMRFSWRVMLRAKGGSVSFEVREGSSARRAYVEPRRYLTDLQEAEMVSQPDLILQLAQVIREDYERNGWEQVQVRAESRVTWNGRRSAALVLPNVDLARVQDGWAPYDWVTSTPNAPPPHTRPVL